MCQHRKGHSEANYVKKCALFFLIAPSQIRRFDDNLTDTQRSLDILEC